MALLDPPSLGHSVDAPVLAAETMVLAEPQMGYRPHSASVVAGPPAGSSLRTGPARPGSFGPNPAEAAVITM